MRDPQSPGNTGWLINQEKLLALVLLDDAVAARLTDRAGAAFFRAFIVQDRETGRIMMRHRFRYKDHDSWFEVEPKEQDGALIYLRESITGMLLTASEMMGNAFSPLDVQIFESPDDEGDFESTVAWLLERDLITVKQS